MPEIHQLIFKLSNTAVGRSGANDSYLLINSKLTSLFPKEGNNFDLVNKSNEDIISLKITRTSNNELRLTKFGYVVSKYALFPGDDFLIEIINGKYYFGFKKNNSYVFQKNKDYFLPLETRDNFKIDICSDFVTYHDSVKLRRDSSKLSKVYLIRDKEIDYKNKVKQNNYIVLFQDNKNNWVIQIVNKFSHNFIS